MSSGSRERWEGNKKGKILALLALYNAGGMNGGCCVRKTKFFYFGRGQNDLMCRGKACGKHKNFARDHLCYFHSLTPGAGLVMLLCRAGCVQCAPWMDSTLG